VNGFYDIHEPRDFGSCNDAKSPEYFGRIFYIQLLFFSLFAFLILNDSLTNTLSYRTSSRLIPLEPICNC
jgi:hypothetical protein